MESTQSPRVLVVDDEELVRTLLGEMVAGTGCYVETAKDGLEALEKIKEGRYDAVFTDLMMPQLGGIDLIHQLKALDPDLPVAVITGYATLDSGIRALKEGALDFISKPFKLDKVQLLVRKLVEARRVLTEDASASERNRIKRLHEDLSQRVEELYFLYETGEEINSIGSNEELLDWLSNKTQDITDVERVSIGFLDGQSFVVKRGKGVGTGDVLPIAGTPLARALATGVSCVGKDDEIDPHTGGTAGSGFLSIPLRIEGEVIGFLNASSRRDMGSFSESQIQTLATLAKKVCLKFENNALYETLYGNFIGTLRALVSTIEARDAYTLQHSERVTQYSLEIGEVLGLSEGEMEAIKFAGYLHDIGKIGVRDTVLLKPGKLTPDEFLEIKAHPTVGDTITQSLSCIPLERTIIRNHHEKWDGSGYPDGLKGKDIPILARVVAVADTYDAMTSNRPYRKSLGHERALQELRDYSDRQFDPDVVAAFLETPTGRKPVRRS